jgi:hypothetical protein
MIEEKIDNIVFEDKAESNNEASCQVLSNAALRDELVFQLSSKMTSQVMKDNAIIISHKYHDRAGYVLYRLNIWATPPVFVINTTDLSHQLIEELDHLKNCDSKRFDKTVTEAIGSLLEGINCRYYHVSGIAYKVSWRFES